MRHGHNQFSFLTDFSNYSNRKSQGSQSCFVHWNDYKTNKNP